VSWEEAIAKRLGSIESDGRWRSVRSLDHGSPATRITQTGQDVVSFASNDYLGLSQHRAVTIAAREAVDSFGAGSGSARLIVGSRPVHHDLEDALADWKSTEAALLFSTGYQANVGVIGSLVGAVGRDQALVLSDELNHASIIDGIRAARSEVVVYRHRDVDHVASVLDDNPGRSAIVVTDSVFSMDGDVAPVDELSEVCADRGALFVIDEAHAVLGPETPRVDPGVRAPIVVGTLSKTLGSLGGFVAASQDVIDLCLNSARSFIFTTASTPADAAAALAALGVIRSPEGAELLARLRENIDILRPNHPSPVIPVMLGDEDRAVAASAALLERGMLVPAIRPPTVAPGSCRLRIAVSAAHFPGTLVALRDALSELDVTP
jgi:8-amino-7-oxononanoate synthase